MKEQDPGPQSPAADVGNFFVTTARTYLRDEYLPRIERCVEQLSDQQIWWRPGPESNSIGNLMLHLSGNARQWIVSGIGGERDERFRDAEFAQTEVIPRDQLLKGLRSTVAEVDRVLGDLAPQRLMTEEKIQGKEVLVLEAVFHVIEHFSMHTGQIITLTKLMTQKDLGFYDFSSGAPVARWNDTQ